ncbi:MAG: hypothetical protein WD423_00725 [Rhodothermales bacterium]
MSRSSNPTAYQLRIELEDIESPVWRRVIVPADASLERWTS